MKLSLNLKYESERSRGWRRKKERKREKSFPFSSSSTCDTAYMMNRERRREFLNIFSSLLLAWDHFAIRVCCRTILLWFIHFILVFPQQWIVVVVVALSRSNRERSSSFFPLPSFFCRLEKYEGTSLWVREEKFEGTWKEQLFYLWKFKSSYNGKVYQGSQQRKGGKKRDNIEAESLAEWWKMRESWAEKSLLELFFVFSISFGCILCMPHQTSCYYCWTMRLKFKFFVGT